MLAQAEDLLSANCLAALTPHTNQYLYYRNDHHWTSLGAYVAYLELSDELGYTPISLDSFTRVSVADDFLGTTHSSAGLPFTSFDSIDLYRYEGDEDYTVEVVMGDTVQKLDGLYDLTKLGSKDKYSVFLGGNYSHVRVTKDGDAEREKLVIIKDSFANSLLPFLARHYRILAVDPRYKTGGLQTIANEVDLALVLCGMQTLTEATFFAPLLRK